MVSWLGFAGVGHSTIYRRVEELKRRDAIRRKVMAIPDFEKLGLSAVIIGMDMHPNELERVVLLLKEHDRIKLLWRTYRTHDLVLAVLCDKDNIGRCIHDLRKELASHPQSSTSQSAYHGRSRAGW